MRDPTEPLGLDGLNGVEDGTEYIEDSSIR
jgi:hypothetical protein